MIKAEDLRIGDLVIVNENCSLEQGTIGKVSEVRSTPYTKKMKAVLVLNPFQTTDGRGEYCVAISTPSPLRPKSSKRMD